MPYNTTPKIVSGMRLKSKRHKPFSRQIANDSIYEYMNQVKKHNDIIFALKDNEYIKYRSFSTRFINILGSNLKRNYFKNKAEFKLFKHLDEDKKLAYLFKKLFSPIDEIRIIISNDNVEYLKKTYTDTGISVLKDTVITLINCIVNRDFDVRDPNKEYNKESFMESCAVLGIYEDKIHFSKVREMFNKQKEEAGDDIQKVININKAFINIRNQYEEYLKCINI